MSKTTLPLLREQIIKFLETTAEATQADIAAATTERDYPSRVTAELNAMRTEVLVECDRRKGKGKTKGSGEMWYWLAMPADTAQDIRKSRWYADRALQTINPPASLSVPA